MQAITPWHKASYDRFIHHDLPQLLADRLPLKGYQVEEAGAWAYRVRVFLDSAEGEVENTYEDIPRPDQRGAFQLEDKLRVVVPVASSANLEKAAIDCVGERLMQIVARRLKGDPGDRPEDARMARAWLPLDCWIRDFLEGESQPLQQGNWLDRETHLRRLLLPAVEDMVDDSHWGRICPVETPEGPNLGRIATVARGASIGDGRLLVEGDQPRDRLGLGTGMIPCLEHSDAARLLMGANMMRQWILPAEIEPALVQTGNEPEAPDFWAGRNLLTAFVPLGACTFEDGIAISQSCARRLDYPQPVEVGDKMSNRHGTKGVVSGIVPDAAMPQLPDGTPVEIVYSFAGMASRMNFGQVREAVLGRIAHSTGQVQVVPPFEAPDAAALRTALQAAGLPEDGQEQLRLDGRPLAGRSTVGWVYWGRLHHLAGDKIRASTTPEERCQRQGEMEFFALRQAGAWETVLEHYNTRDERRPDAGELAPRVAVGPVAQAGPPAPVLTELTGRLACAGIEIELQGEELRLGWGAPAGEVLTLAQTLPHPWMRQRALETVGARPELPEYGALVAANQRLQRSQTGPSSLQSRALAQLEERLSAYCEALIQAPELRLSNRILFSGRGVLAPGVELGHDQVGVPAEIAWTLFGPLLERELDAAQVERRSTKAVKALERTMAESWVLVTRAPVLTPTGLLGFKPVLVPGRAILLAPVACSFMNADFDGDQAALMLPLTEGGQREAAQLLSLAGHLRRDPDLIDQELWRVKIEAVWGLARLGLEAGGLEEIAQLAGATVATEDGVVTSGTLARASKQVAQRDGAEAALAAVDRLLQRGFAVARVSGASVSPFLGASLHGPAAPGAEEGEAAWDAYFDEIAGCLAAHAAWDDNDLGPLCLLSRSRGRGPSWSQLAMTVGVARPAQGGGPGRRSLVAGLTPGELRAAAGRFWRTLAQLHAEAGHTGRSLRRRQAPTGFDVLARAQRAKAPGVVFARAAAAGTTDTLTDPSSRAFAGLAPR